MKILGISAHYHDSAAALVVDGVPISSVQEERISRRKNDASFPLGAIEWCLSKAGLEPEELDAVVFYEKPMLKFERILTTALRAFPRSWRSFPQAMKSSLGEKLWIKGVIGSHSACPAARFCSPSIIAPTRPARFSRLPPSGRDPHGRRGGGVGDALGRAEASAARRRPRSTLARVRFPHSLGMLYSTFTAFLGFQVNEGEYKVMGLASYGKPRFEDR